MNYKCYLRLLIIVGGLTNQGAFAAQSNVAQGLSACLKTAQSYVSPILKTVSDKANPIIKQAYDKTKPYLTKGKVGGACAILAAGVLVYKYLNSPEKKIAGNLKLNIESNFMPQVAVLSELCATDSVEKIKIIFKKVYKVSYVNNNYIEVYFESTKLEDEKTIGFYNIQNGSTLRINIKPTLMSVQNGVITNQIQKLPIWVQNFLKFTGQKFHIGLTPSPEKPKPILPPLLVKPTMPLTKPELPSLPTMGETYEQAPADEPMGMELPKKPALPLVPNKVFENKPQPSLPQLPDLMDSIADQAGADLLFDTMVE